MNNIERIQEILAATNHQNIGDNLQEIINIRKKITNPVEKQIIENLLGSIRLVGYTSDFGDRLFSLHQDLPRGLSNIEITQLVLLERALHELCYACEQVNNNSTINGEEAPPTRFYLNSIYPYVASMFLVDQSKLDIKGLQLGGSVTKALHSIELDDFLNPIAEILHRPLTDKITFGDTILKLRHSFLVHGDFSPDRIQFLNRKTEMQNPKIGENFSDFIWDLYYEILLLRLKILALLSHNNIDIEQSMIQYYESL